MFDPQVRGSSPYRATTAEPNPSLTFGLPTSTPQPHSRAQRVGGERGSVGYRNGVRPRESRSYSPAYASVRSQG